MRLPYRGAGCLLYTTDSEGTTWIYLGRRRLEPGRGKWSIPGGGAEGGGRGKSWEPFWHTARRETWEETRIDLSLLDSDKDEPPPFVSIWFPGFWWRTYLVAVDRRMKLQPCHEFTEDRWFRLDSLPRDLAFGMKRALGKLRRRVKRGAKAPAAVSRR
jgi:8-oxo-dGTP pyrophosphatase MutT (NUDIX family)